MVGVTHVSAAFRCSQTAVTMLQRPSIRQGGRSCAATRIFYLIERIKRTTHGPIRDLALAQVPAARPSAPKELTAA
jgi:hypothetical protein